MEKTIAAAAVAASMLLGCSGPIPGETSDARVAGTQRPAKLGLCVACHGESGISRIPGTPHIAGQDEAYLRRSLTHYRDNRRQGGAMNAAAGSLSDGDIRELAAWYARHPWLGQEAGRDEVEDGRSTEVPDVPAPGSDHTGGDA